MRPGRRVRSWTLAGLCVALVSLGLLTPGAATPTGGEAKAGGKANLIVTAVRFTPRAPVGADGPNLALIDREGRGRFAYAFVIKNAGNQTAPASTAVVFVDNDRIDAVGLPALKPNQRELIDGSAFRRLDPGFRRLRVCADHRDDVPESREAGNCRKRRFAALPRFWEVNRFSVRWENEEGPFSFTQAVAMDFGYYDYFKVPGQGTEYVYVARGIVDEVQGGTDPHPADPCTYSGSGQVSRYPWGDRPPREGFLTIHSSLQLYQSVIHDQTARGRYNAVQNCTVTGPEEYKKRFRALGTVALGTSRPADDDSSELARDTNPGADTLQGARVFTRSTGGGFSSETYNYRWKFTADIP